MQRLQLCAYDNVAGSVRRSVWAEHRFGHRRFGEDVAFGKRLILAGHAILYEPRAVVIHSHNRTPQAEGKRIYCDHANLKELFGVHLIKDRAAYRRAVHDARIEFGRRIDALDVADADKHSLRQWANQYARWSALGTYLGGNADRLQKGVRGVGFRWLDRFLRKGI